MGGIVGRGCSTSRPAGVSIERLPTVTVARDEDGAITITFATRFAISGQHPGGDDTPSDADHRDLEASGPRRSG